MAICNACLYDETSKRLKKEGKKLKLVTEKSGPCAGWQTLYVVGEPPCDGQGEPSRIDGKQVRFVSSYAEIAHSNDEDCWK